MKTLTQPKQKWDTPETLSIPGTHAYYTLVSLTFHQSSPIATADPFPDPGGHFSSLLRHIGASDVLVYNDLRNPVFQPATTKQKKDFTTGNMRHAPVAAIYYLVGGEATQKALYQQHLEYLNTHFGISIQPPSHTGQWSWPSTASLSPPIPGNFRELPYPLVQTHFNTIHNKSYHIELHSSQVKAKVHRCSYFPCLNLSRTCVAEHTCGSNRAILFPGQRYCPSQEADCSCCSPFHS